MAMQYGGEALTPGIQAERTTVEAQLWFGRIEQQQFQGGILDSTATDTGHTSQTTQLRPGLLLAQLTATKKLVPWSPYVTVYDGSQTIAGILNHHIAMKLYDTAVDRHSNMLFYGGNVKAAEILVPGATTAGISGDN